MSISSGRNGSVTAALEELRVQLKQLDTERTKLNAAIAALEALDDNAQLDLINEPHPVSRVRTRSSPKPYANLTFIEAAKNHLSNYSPQTTRELSDALLAGGFRSQSENFMNVVGTMLRKYGYAGNQHGIEKNEDGLWTMNTQG